MKTERSPKEKFGLLNFASLEVLSKEEMKNVKGGYNPADGWSHNGTPVPYICLNLNAGYDTVKCSQSECDSYCGGVPCVRYNNSSYFC